ncbi:oxidoreductase [Microlunatus endophyticus]|uniref:Oxidoreductase n=1 Tax=Microlunatus endophyticus TaxID=1716077 RepID=A0A917S9A6_9ACTN|nr:aldo/keto reductase [Microlunatus endophyticus]GGL65518.1 oxidoreductase [Microlunatus endophyticus]
MAQVPTVTLNDGRAIPQLGIGVWQVSNDDIEATVAKALEVGYRHIDTAQGYQNEKGVGDAFTASGLSRHDVWVTTKLANGKHSRTDAVDELKISLEKLGMDYVDLYLIHWPTPTKGDFVETWRGMQDALESGLAKSIGVSNFQPAHLDAVVADGGVVPAVNQIELHPTFANQAAVDGSLKHGIKVESWSPLGLGADLGNDTVARIAAATGKTPAQVIIRWHLQKGYIVFPKSVTPSRIEENFDVFDFELTTDDLAAIDALDAGNRTGGNPDIFG